MHSLNVLILLLMVNGAPLLLSVTFPRTKKRPLDHGLKLRDGFRLLGKHKTLLGFSTGVLAGGLWGLFLGPSLWTGLVSGFLAMAGDSFSSFIKRRLHAPPGSEVPILDQVFEAGFPLLYIHYTTAYTYGEAALTFALFVAVVWAISGVRYRLFFPAVGDHLRIVRSAKRRREWRACHIALSPFARLLNFENVIYYRWIMAGAFKGVGLYTRGKKNALDVRLKRITLSLPRLPAPFNSYRILFMSDLHLDGIDGLTERLIEMVQSIDADVCLLGGDYRMEMYGSFFSAKRRLRKLVRHIRTPDGIYGILGNHDCLGLTPDLEESGLYMLVNDSVYIEKSGARLHIAGVDDPHYYRCHSLDAAFREIPKDAFTLLLAHSPEIVHDMNGHRIDLCLCGHTHGGQIRLPGIGAVFTHCRTPRRFAAGHWQHNGTTGYTSYGAGSSGIPVRFNCPPEIVLLTLTTD